MFTALSIKMQFWVSAPFLLEDCSPALTKQCLQWQDAISSKNFFSLITSSDLIIRLRYRASRMSANGQRENLKKPITPNERGLRRKRPNDRNERGGCVVFSNTSHLSHFRDYKLSWYYYQISLRYLSRYRKQRLWQAINKFFVICYQPSKASPTRSFSSISNSSNDSKRKHSLLSKVMWCFPCMFKVTSVIFPCSSKKWSFSVCTILLFYPINL